MLTNLVGCGIGDESLPYIAALRKLTSLDLGNLSLKQAAIESQKRDQAISADSPNSRSSKYVSDFSLSQQLNLRRGSAQTEPAAQLHHIIHRYSHSHLAENKIALEGSFAIAKLTKLR